jgi:5-methylcytosine-specific restriction endonuclease McrA
MFLRLQNGTSLKAQEKRNAMPGNMRSFVKALTEHAFFGSVAFANSRFAHDHVAAQVSLIELTGEPCNIKNANLNSMYKDYADFDGNGPKAKKIQRVLNYLRACFPTKTPELERYNVISLYAMASHLLERYVVQDRQANFAKWFLEFEAYRRAEEKKPEDQCDQEITVYHERISHSTDAVDSLTWRHEFLMRKLFERFPDIKLKDNQRMFSHEQRLAIYRRDNGICQVRVACAGDKCEWDNWEADHMIPWSGGGATTVENGQVACAACNRVKADE